MVTKVFQKENLEEKLTKTKQKNGGHFGLKVLTQKHLKKTKNISTILSK